MFRVNMVFDDEELLEPYEWERDDEYKEYSHLPIFRVDTDTLHDFLYGKLVIDNMSDDMFIVSDTHYCFVVEMKDGAIYKRGSLDYKERDKVNDYATYLLSSEFSYHILEEAYEKEFGLTREERMKKIYLEDVLDEIFVVRYDAFKDICESLHIHEDTPSELYMTLKRKIEKGYTKFHELLYLELINKS